MTQRLRHDILDKLARWKKEWSAHTPGQNEHYLMMQELAQSHAAPFTRTSFEPGHFTASAFVVDQALSKVLLVFHKKLQRWLQPGGHFEVGDDSSLAAARREVLEETGVVTQTFKGFEGLYDLDVHRIPAHAGEGCHRHYDLRFVLCAQSETLQQNNEVEDARFWPLNRVEHLSRDESVVRVIKSLQGQRDRFVGSDEAKWV
jgi:8-oxo-dGTP pyrophosphatase MutT (NUDIX family)